MSEAGVLEGGAGPVPADKEQAVSAGGLLRRAREAAGLHPAALAVALKVPVGKLEALEQDRYELLPDAVFTRALASAICRNLKVDPQPVLDRLPQTRAPRLSQDTDGLNAPFRSPRDGVAPQWRDQLTRPVSLAVAALLVGVVVVLLLPRPGSDNPAPAGEEQAAPAVPARATPAAPVQGSGPLMTTSVAVLPAPPAVATAAVPAPAAAPLAAPAPAAENTDTTPSAAAATGGAMAPAADGTVVFRTSGTAWVEVRDAKGAVPIRRLLAAGESAGASGAMPLQVTVGKVDSTEVQVRGKPFDLKPYARDNVARFEVQ